MKKLFFSLFLMTGICLSSYAQAFKGGLKAGLNVTNLKFDKEVFDSQNSVGYLAGAWVRLGGAAVHLQPEIYFTSKNAEVHPKAEDAAGAAIKGDVKFSNIDVPVLLGTRIPLGLVNARVQAGPLFSFIVNQENSLGDNLEQSYKDAITNYKDRYAAILGGVGVDIGAVSVDVRYEHGLGNISKNSDKQTLNLWTIGVGFSLF